MVNFPVIFTILRKKINNQLFLNSFFTVQPSTISKGTVGIADEMASYNPQKSSLLVSETSLIEIMSRVVSGKEY
jgi:hypothetical protein